MELVKRVINDNEYTFVNKTWENSNGWGHETTLFKRHYEIGHNKVRYYNRTWESYRYRTCMSGCVYELISKRENELKVLDDKKFLDVTKALLKMRRKTIQNNLNAYLPSKNDVKEVLDDLNIDPLTRAESLTLEDFIKITNKICEKYPRQ